jgi:hypothetical protein
VESDGVRLTVPILLALDKGLGKGVSSGGIIISMACRGSDGVGGVIGNAGSLASESSASSTRPGGRGGFVAADGDASKCEILSVSRTGGAGTGGG